MIKPFPASFAPEKFGCQITLSIWSLRGEITLAMKYIFSANFVRWRHQSRKNAFHIAVRTGIDQFESSSHSWKGNAIEHLKVATLQPAVWAIRVSEKSGRLARGTFLFLVEMWSDKKLHVDRYSYEDTPFVVSSLWRNQSHDQSARKLFKWFLKYICLHW